MAYRKRIPPIAVELTTTKYNLLMEYLSSISDEEQRVAAEKLKEKLLRYSIPCITERGTFILVRFFNQEVVQLINLLINKINTEESSINYYELLLENRNKKEENKDG